MLYLIAVDRDGVMGMGKDAVVTYPTNTDGIEILTPKDGKWYTFRLPYPMGFMPRSPTGPRASVRCAQRGEFV